MSSWKFPGAFWIANGVELLERASFYAVFITFTLYLSDIVGFDDIDAEASELASNLEFLATRHGGAWALLAVAKSGVEDLNMRARGHRTSLARNSQWRT